MKKATYWIDPNIDWKTYKKLIDKTATKDSGPTPKHLDRMLWELLRERRLNIYITNGKDETVFPTLKKIPKGASLITNPK